VDIGGSVGIESSRPLSSPVARRGKGTADLVSPANSAVSQAIIHSSLVFTATAAGLFLLLITPRRHRSSEGSRRHRAQGPAALGGATSWRGFAVMARIRAEFSPMPPVNTTASRRGKDIVSPPI
jgi:hypothetical protein